MATWNEADHPRDDEGKFTYKGGGTSTSSNDEKMQHRADTLYPTMNNKQSKENYDDVGLGKTYTNKELSREDILYPSMKSKKDEGELTGGAANLRKSQIKYDYPKYKKYIENNLENNKEENIKYKFDSSDNAKFSDTEIKKARIFIQGVENFRADAHKPTPNDVWTIGYGHTGLVDGKPIEKGMLITREKGEELYRQDFETHTKGLKNIQVPLTSNQKIALASFMYNLGPNVFNRKSNLLEKLNSGDMEGAIIELEKYNKQRNRKTGELEIVDGLVNRRRKEKELFLKPDGE